MKHKFTKEEQQELIKFIVKNNAKEYRRKFYDNKLPWEVRIENGFYGFGYYPYIWGAWVFRNYRELKEFLRIKLGITIIWIIIVAISAWTLANILHGASQY